MSLGRTLALFLCVLTFSMLNSGCWATLSELKKERYLRKELEKQFQSFKRSQLKKERLYSQQRRQDQARLAAVMANLRLQSNKTQDLFDKLEKQIKQGQGGVAEMLATMQRLQAKFQEFLGQFNEVQKQMGEMSKKSPEANKQFAEVLEKNKLLIQRLKELEAQIDPAKMYAAAKDAMKSKDYPKAIRLFRRFTKRFAQHDLAEKAYFRLALIYLEQGKTNAAIIELADLVKRYPQGDKAQNAYFRLGFLHYKLKKCRQGRRYFRRAMLLRGRDPKLAKEARLFYRRHRRLCKGSRSRRPSRRRRRRRRRTD